MWIQEKPRCRRLFLYASGTIRKLGKVDTKDAFLDTDARERDRGNYNFFQTGGVDLAGNGADFAGHAGTCRFFRRDGRVLQVLDYAVLLISRADGVQGTYTDIVESAATV